MLKKKPSFLGEGCEKWKIVSGDFSIMAIGEHITNSLIISDELVLFDTAVVTKILATLTVAVWKDSTSLVAEGVEDSQKFATR